MKEQQFADLLCASHMEALHLMTDGLCRIRESAIEAPAHAMRVADAMHNIPGILAGEDRAGDGYLAELIAEGRALVNDNTWRKTRQTEENRMSQNPRTPLYLAVWCLAASALQLSLPAVALMQGSLFLDAVTAVSLTGAAITLPLACVQWKCWKKAKQGNAR